MHIIKLFRARIYRNQVSGLPIGLRRYHSDLPDYRGDPVCNPKIEDLCYKRGSGPVLQRGSHGNEDGSQYADVSRYVGAEQRGEGCSGPCQTISGYAEARKPKCRPWPLVRAKRGKI